jgi:phenylpyruvate tautomerase PptA (4-oxalocrotonate tautomerase family)
MPRTRIVTGEWAREHEMELIEAIQSALVSSIKIPDWDRDIVVDLYDGKRRIVPTGRSDRYTRIEIELFAGRSMDAKRALYRAIVQNVSTLGVPETKTKTVLIEVPLENWGLRGGSAGTDVDLGFRVEV